MKMFALILISLLSTGVKAMPTGTFDTAPYDRIRDLEYDKRTLLTALIRVAKSFDDMMSKTRDELIGELHEAHARFENLEIKELVYKGMEPPVQVVRLSVNIGPFILERYREGWVVKGQSDLLLEKLIQSDPVASSLVKVVKDTNLDYIYRIDTKSGLARFIQILDEWRNQNEICDNWLK